MLLFSYVPDNVMKCPVGRLLSGKKKTGREVMGAESLNASIPFCTQVLHCMKLLYFFYPCLSESLRMPLGNLILFNTALYKFRREYNLSNTTQGSA